MRYAVIAGASGLIGDFLLKELLNDPDYQVVTTLVRKPLECANPKLRELTVDFANLPQTQIERPADSTLELFCTLGTTIKKAGSREAFRAVDHDAVLNFAKWGLAQNATHFYVVTAMGANAHSSVFYNRVKGETENDLKALGYTSLKIFRPSLLLGRRKETRPMERLAEKTFGALSFVFKGGLKKYEPVKAETVARAIVRSTKHKASGVFESDDIQGLARETI